MHEEQWVIVNLDGEYLERVNSNLSEQYTKDANKALKFKSCIEAQRECDVFERPKRIS